MAAKGILITAETVLSMPTMAISLVPIALPSNSKKKAPMVRATRITDVRPQFCRISSGEGLNTGAVKAAVRSHIITNRKIYLGFMTEYPGLR